MNPAQFNRFVNHWCGDQAAHEPLEIRIARALMNCAACVQTHQDIAAGQTPIRPLDTFPSAAYPEGGVGI